jgi:hypothetical protein
MSLSQALNQFAQNLGRYLQSVSFSYSDADGYSYEEHYDIDLKDIAYVSEIKVDR